jgi:hypothetical protein
VPTVSPESYDKVSLESYDKQELIASFEHTSFLPKVIASPMQVLDILASAKEASCKGQSKGGEHMKFGVTTGTIPAVSTSKGG